MVHFQSKTGGRTENQDAFGFITTSYGELIVVCDGMGGHKGGSRASNMAVNVVLEEIQKVDKKQDALSAIKTAIEIANMMICEESRSNPQYHNMGTTLVALLITPDKAICCHVGDSRVYQLRDGKIVYRTFDHSHVFELVKAGLMTEEEARISSQSNIITRALGLSPEVEIDIEGNLSYHFGDRFLLCTDGIWGELPEAELVDFVSQELEVKQIAEELAEKIDSIGFDNGGRHDNLTVALLEIDKNHRPKNKNKKCNKGIPIVEKLKKFFSKHNKTAVS